jgi:mono/diheme cytochrome c family protein
VLTADNLAAWSLDYDMDKTDPVEIGKSNGALYVTVRLLRVVAIVVLLHGAVSADGLQEGIDAYLQRDYDSAFATLSPAATTKNPLVQNLVGIMLYEGRGTTANPLAAHKLFHSAAALGVMDASRNLGILHTVGAPGVPVDYVEAKVWFNAATAGDNQNAAEPHASSINIPATVESVINVEFEYDGEGKQIYLTYCAGCHGFSGMRFFPSAPSFAMGDRMTKNTDELLQSILRGKGMMPAWEDKLPLSEIKNALGYLRELGLRTGYGTDTSAYDAPPDRYYIFSPMGFDDSFTLELRANTIVSD